ncbi:MAG TPA: hypothetical protein ENK43_13740 [Planctomycetes bacterium]|nr:hypothetical protein [Planctomycetota bacterium]
MTRNEAIYVELARMAALEDGGSSERRALEIHRKVLGLSRTRARQLRNRLPREPVDLTQFVSGNDDSELILRMLVRVAASDNEITRREHRRLRQVAAELGVEELGFQNLVAEALSKAEFRARSLVRYRRIVVVVLILGSILWWNQRRGREESEDSSARNRTEFADRMADIELRACELARAEARKAARTEVEKGIDPQLDTNLTRRFQEVLDRKKDTFIFLYTYGTLVRRDAATRRKMTKDFGATGTGFVLSPDGHVATNKHVVEPWKFDPALAALVSRGWAVDSRSLVRVAWLAESRVMDAHRRILLKTGYASSRGTLALSALAPDAWRPRSSVKAPRRHKGGPADLAVLKLKMRTPTDCLPLDVDASHLRPLDPVMVCGFPLGFNIFETGIARFAPTIGSLRKVDANLFVSASVHPGNSGGPILDERGRVIAVTAARWQDATLGSGILARHLLPLLPDGGHWLERARSYARAGCSEAARCALDLARLRGAALQDVRRVSALLR